jgi:pyruvate/2-oxoglutarate dehydrogenase complex dihydrolipoamide dehydrogenase (E3) component
VLIERGKMGGDCLNTGCVPSKALLASAKAARRWRADQALGVAYAPPTIDFAAVNRHVHGVIGAIARNDSVERFEGLGVKVIKGTGRFVGPHEMAVNGTRIRARRFVVASGSRAGRAADRRPRQRALFHQRDHFLKRSSCPAISS